jgi:hypothetical protein
MAGVCRAHHGLAAAHSPKIAVGDFAARAVLVYGPHEKVFRYKGLPENRYKDP